ncbi:MAG: heme-binding protein [Proteobacteria bacterium]|nr:heme-binding protein [Pseudomonadota bacterium]
MRFGILVFSLLCAQAIFALDTKPYLTLEMATKIADACEAKAQAEGWQQVNIAIYDDGGNLKLFRRQDGAYLHSIKIAKLKGHTASGMPRSTRKLGEINYSKDPPYGIDNVPGFVIFPGGLPILTAAGDQLGGIGVSGATGDQDEACGQAGLDAIADLLK